MWFQPMTVTGASWLKRSCMAVGMSRCAISTLPEETASVMGFHPLKSVGGATSMFSSA